LNIQSDERAQYPQVPATPPTHYTQPRVSIQPSSPKELLEKALPPKLSEEQAQELFAVISARLPDVAPPRVATLPVPKPQVVRPTQQNVARPSARMQPAPVTPHDITKLVMDKRSPERAAYRQQVANNNAPPQHRDRNSAFRTPHRPGQGVGTTVVPSRYESTPAPGGYFYRPGANATPRAPQRSQMDEDEEQSMYQPGPTSSANPRKRVARRSPPREHVDAGEYQHAYDRPPVKRRAVDANRSYGEYDGTPAPFKGSRVDPSTITGSPIHMSTQAQKIFNSIEKMSTPFIEPSPVFTSHKVVEYYRDRERELLSKPSAHDELELPPSTSIVQVIPSSQKKRKRDVEVPPPSQSPWSDDAEEDADLYSSSRKARKTGDDSKVTTARSDFKSPAAKAPGSFQFSDSSRFKSAMADTSKRSGFPLASGVGQKKSEPVITLDDDQEEDEDFAIPADDEEEDEEEDDMQDDDEEISEDADAVADEEEEEEEKSAEKPKSVFSSKPSPPASDVFAPTKGSPFALNVGTGTLFPIEKPALGFPGSFSTSPESGKDSKPAFGGFAPFSAASPLAFGEKKDTAKEETKSIFGAPSASFGTGFTLNAASKDDKAPDSVEAKEKEEKEKKEKEEKERKEKEEKEKKAKEEAEKKEKEAQEKKQKEEKERKEKEDKERLEKEKREAEELKKKEEEKKAEDTKPVGFSFGGSFDMSKSSVLSDVAPAFGDSFKAPVTTTSVGSILKLDAAPDASFDKTKISFGVPAAAPAATSAVSTGKDEPAAATPLFSAKPVDIFGFGSSVAPTSSDSKKESASIFGAAKDQTASPFGAPKVPTTEEKSSAPTAGFGTFLGAPASAKKVDAVETKPEALPTPLVFPTPSIKDAAPPTSSFTYGTTNATDGASKSLTNSSPFSMKDTPAATGFANPFGASTPAPPPVQTAPLFGGGSVLGNPFDKKLDAPTFGLAAAPSFGAKPAETAAFAPNIPASTPPPAPGFGGFAAPSNPPAPAFGGAGFGGSAGFNPTANPFDNMATAAPAQSFNAAPAPSFGGGGGNANGNPFGGASFGNSAAPASAPFGGGSSFSNAPTPFAAPFGNSAPQTQFGGDSGFGAPAVSGYATPFGSQAPQTQASSSFGGGSFASGGGSTAFNAGAGGAPAAGAFNMGAADTSARKKYVVKRKK
jgi:hypothetical protein